MAVYFEPSWGERLRDSFSRIGTGLRDIVNPNFEQQKSLMDALNDPIKAQQIANLASINPSLYSPENKGVGKRNAATIAKLKPTQQFTNEQTIAARAGTELQDESVASDAARSSIGVQTANQKELEEQNLRLNSLRLEDLVQYNNYLKANPGLQDDANALRAMGMLPEQRDAVRREAQLVEEGLAMNPVEGRALIEQAASGDFQDFRKLEAFARANPTAYKLIVDQMDFERRASFELEMFRRRASVERGLTNEQRVFQARLATAQSLANQYDISIEVAAKRLGYDKLDPNFTQLTQGVTEFQVNQAENKISEVDRRRTLNNQTEVQRGKIRAVSMINDVLGKADKDKKNMPVHVAQINEMLHDYNQFAQRAIRAEYDTKGRNEIKFYDEQNREVKFTDLVTLPPATNPVTRVAPITVTPGGTSVGGGGNTTDVSQMSDEELRKLAGGT